MLQFFVDGTLLLMNYSWKKQSYYLHSLRLYFCLFYIGYILLTTLLYHLLYCPFSPAQVTALTMSMTFYVRLMLCLPQNIFQIHV